MLRENHYCKNAKKTFFLSVFLIFKIGLLWEILPQCVELSSWTIEHRRIAIDHQVEEQNNKHKRQSETLGIYMSTPQRGFRLSRSLFCCHLRSDIFHSDELQAAELCTSTYVLLSCCNSACARASSALNIHWIYKIHVSFSPTSLPFA